MSDKITLTFTTDEVKEMLLPLHEFYIFDMIRDELILKSDVIELIDKYYDKFTYESDADELIVEIEHMKGVG